MAIITKDHSSQNDFTINIRKDNALWLGINNYSVRIEQTKEGLTVSIYDWDKSNTPLSSATTSDIIKE
jgi:hypothetical protein